MNSINIYIPDLLGISESWILPESLALKLMNSEDLMSRLQRLVW